MVIAALLSVCHGIRSAHQPLWPEAAVSKRRSNRLEFLNRATGHTVWKKQVGYLDCVGWSHDHKALALSITSLGETPFRLLIWQKGTPVRLLDDSPVPPGYGGGYIDGVVDIVWSPDDRRVLFRIWQSGSKSMNLGVLECLDTKHGQISTLPGDVRQMQWLGPHRVKYRVMKIVTHGNDETLIEDARPRYWNFH